MDAEIKKINLLALLLSFERYWSPYTLSDGSLYEKEAKEEALKQREEVLKESKEDTQALIKQVKDEYDGKLSKLTETYEAKIKERNNVIKQLLSDGNANEPQQNDIIAKINAQRLAQNKKW